MYLYWIITNKKRNGDSMKKALVIIDVQNDYFKKEEWPFIPLNRRLQT